MIVAQKLNFKKIIDLAEIKSALKTRQTGIKELPVGKGAHNPRIKGVTPTIISCQWVQPHVDQEYHHSLFVTWVIQADTKHVVGTHLTPNEAARVGIPDFHKAQANIRPGELFFIEPQRLHWLLWENSIRVPRKNFVAVQYVVDLREKMALPTLLKHLSNEFGGQPVNAGYKKWHNQIVL